MPRSRLQNFNTSSAVISWIISHFLVIWIATQIVGIAVAIFTPEFSSSESCKDIAIALLTAAPAVGTLALSTLFINAQLNTGAGRRAGTRQLYRARHAAPLAAALTFLIPAAVFALVLADDVPTNESGNALDSDLYWPSLTAKLALSENVALVLGLIYVLLRLTLFLDDQWVARHLAWDLEGEDALVWGLFDLDEPAKWTSSVFRPHVQVDADRFNAGLRDPLMPIHELLKASEDRDFAGLAGSLLRRVAHEYGVHWEDQAPDHSDWMRLGARVGRVPASTRYKELRNRLQARCKSTGATSSVEMRRSRMRLTLLVLHYLRRIPRNTALPIAREYRRQYITFILTRFAFLITFSATRIRSGVSLAELQLVVDYTLYAIAEVERDFMAFDVLGHKEPTWALLTIARCCESVGWVEEENLARHILAWSIGNTRHCEVGLAQADNSNPDVLRFTVDWRATINNLTGREEIPTIPSLFNPWDSWRLRTGNSVKLKPDAALGEHQRVAPATTES